MLARELSTSLSSANRGKTLNAITQSGRIEPGSLSVTLDLANLAEHLGVTPGHINPDDLALSGGFTLSERGGEARLILGDSATGVYRTLLGNVARGWSWFEEIKSGISMQAIAEREGVSQRRVAHLVDLAFLAPDIVQSIVDGRQPAALTSHLLIRSRHRPFWDHQRAWLSGL